MLSRSAGCMLGSALGDALGGPVEFMTRAQILGVLGPDGVVDPWQGSGFARACYTDDTQLAVAVAEAVLHADDPFDLVALEFELRRFFVRWHKQNLFERGHSRAPGGTCSRGCDKLAHLDDPPPWFLDGEGEGLRPVDEPTRRSKGAGTTMRVHPLAVAFSHRVYLLHRAAVAQAELTHDHPVAAAAARYQAELVAEVLESVEPARAAAAVAVLAETWRPDFLSEEQHAASGELAPRLRFALELARGKLPAYDALERLGQAWTADEALAMTVFLSVRFAGDYLGGVRAAVNIDGDSDTLATMVGAVLGAAHPDQIPEAWLARLEARRYLESLAWGLDHLKENDHEG